MSTPIRPLSGTDFPAPAALPDEPVECLLIEAEDRSRLEGAAETVGTTLGRAVNKVRDLPRQVRDLPRRFTVIRGGAADKASDVADQASVKIGEIKDQASSRLTDMKQQARRRAEDVRFQVRRYIHEYPLQCLGGIFGVAVITGMTLRIWRTRD